MLTLTGTETERAVQFADELASALGDSWTRDPDPTHQRTQRLCGPMGFLLSVKVEPYGHKGRAVIEGDFPQAYYSTAYGREHRPEITCALARGIEAIADDVRRRLLPIYHEKLVKVLKLTVDAIDYQERKERLTNEAAAILDTEPRGEMIYGHGTISLQIVSDKAIRFARDHCGYITLDQLRKIKEVCPELFYRRNQEEPNP